MSKSYSQFRAMMAMTKASLIAIFRSPSAVVFTLAFPLIFILVFGFIGQGGLSVTVGLAPGTDTSNLIYKSLDKVDAVHFRLEPHQQMVADLQKGHITAILGFKQEQQQPQGPPNYQVEVTTSTASADKIQVFQSILRDVINTVNHRVFKQMPTVAQVHTTILPGRAYKQIDFILPGMLGFSLLSAGVFGTAFLFFSLRQTLVLKRFFATPVNRTYIVVGEALARLIFQLMGAIIIIGLGYFIFNYTLIHGFWTFIEMLILSVFGLLIFMGFGFIVSSIAKNESTIPPLANVVTLPQFLLAGTFFPIDVFPNWLQPICRFMPLTYLNDAMRKVAFEGLSFADIWFQLLILLIWGIVVYAVAIKVFKWE